MAIIGVSGLIVCVPIFDDAAAPEMAITLAISSPGVAASISLVATYPVVLLPMNLGLNKKKSAFRPLLLATFEFWTLRAVLMRWYGPYVLDRSLNLMFESGSSAFCGKLGFGSNRKAFPSRSR
jgi:hypothetical protein